jgi:demethylmenaquinone methyltransferase/2-methoxy-6-polyprenyl-1,4-benzoquinol methylase
MLGTRKRTQPDAPRGGATLEPAAMAAMFDDVAPTYDRLNTLMTLGSDVRWRRRAVEETHARLGESVIDVCCGTGKLAAQVADRVGPFGRVEGVDLSAAMIRLASQHFHSLVQARFSVANAMELPFDDATFDAATIGFGLRNLPDFEGGFREMARVVRPGGRVVCLELSLPKHRAIARAYHAVFRRTAPLAARLLRGPRQAYAYLPQSLDGFPAPEQLAAAMSSAGLADVRFARLSGGMVAVHVGTVPAPAKRSEPDPEAAATE